jgi:UDP-glucuronate 4-epimerase
VRQSVENPWVYVDTNVTGYAEPAGAGLPDKIPKFILASTSSVYGAMRRCLPRKKPQRSAAAVICRQQERAEALCHAYHYLYGLDVTVFRYFTVYGPAGRPDMVMFRFARWIEEGYPLKVNGDGEQSRGFTYVDDIARGTLWA